MELDQFRDVDLVIDYANYSFIEKQFVSQGDYKGRTLTVQVTNNGVVGEVPGLMLNLNWHNQASGLTDLSAFSVLDKANSIYRIEYPQHMMTPGKVLASIQVIQNGKVTNLKQFELTVQKIAGQPIGIVEKAEFSALVAVLADSNRFRTDIDSLNITKADKTQVATKADKTYVDSMLSSIAQGGPRELFYSLAALKSKYPSGADGTYLVFDSATTDGAHSYMWDESTSSWKDLGIYQAHGLNDDSVDLTKLIGKKMYDILPKKRELWNTFRIAFELGKSISYNQKVLSTTDFFYSQEAAKGIYSDFIEVSDRVFLVDPGAHLYIAILEFDSSGLGVNDSGWIRTKGIVTLQSATSKIILAVRKKSETDSFNLRTEEPLLKTAMVMCNNTLMETVNHAADSVIIPTVKELQYGFVATTVNNIVSIIDSNSRLCFVDIPILPSNEYSVVWDNQEKYNVAVFMIDDADKVINLGPWMTSPADFKPHSQAKKIYLNIKHSDDTTITTSAFYDMNLRIIPKTLSNEPEKKDDIKMNLMSDFDIDYFENGTFANLTSDRKNIIKRANQVGRVRSRISIPLEKGKWYQFDVRCPDEFRYSLQYCDVNDYHLFDTGWFEGRYHVYAEEDMFVWMLFKKNEDDNMVVDDIAQFSFNVIQKDREQNQLLDRSFAYFAAHRGATEFAPENTLASALEAKKAGFDFVEMDVQLTKDLVPIIMHDETVDRTTDGTGTVRELDYSYIRTLKIDAGNGLENYPNEIVPTFEEMLLRCKLDRLMPVIHMNYIRSLSDVDYVLTILREMNMIDKVFMIPPGNEAMVRIKKKEPRLYVARIVQSYSSLFADKRRILCHENTAIAGWFLEDSEAGKDWIKSLKEHGVLINGYVINDKNLSVTAFATGVDIVTTDKSSLIELQ
ncbi:glycerophosphodiester phosphodiesterase [Enterococcus casseliflavus]|uniref:glycerophosphodiester phosphodiesterase n=1 Tax=Enterococcus casseliflavus TaxID=37734 RepID=UPI003D0DECEC